jgi:hypothetical protein
MCVCVCVCVYPVEHTDELHQNVRPGRVALEEASLGSLVAQQGHDVTLDRLDLEHRVRKGVVLVDEHDVLALGELLDARRRRDEAVREVGVGVVVALLLGPLDTGGGVVPGGNGALGLRRRVVI